MNLARNWETLKRRPAWPFLALVQVSIPIITLGEGLVTVLTYVVLNPEVYLLVVFSHFGAALRCGDGCKPSGTDGALCS